MPWWDRVRAMRVESIPTDPLPGRYLVASGSHVVVNGVPTRAGDHLAAKPNGKWSTSAAAGEKLHGEFREVELLRALEASSLLGIVEGLDAGGNDGITWSRLVHESPLVHPAPEHLEPTRIDREIKRHGPHLLEVSRQPHSVLDAVVEPTLAARAKRIPPRAVQYLAGHSEDWHRRTVTSVIPRRVLAQRVDERLDVYENRVVARLTDELLAYLRARLADLRELSDLFADVADFSSALSAQHRVARRLSELWGDGFGEGDELERIEQLEQALLDRRRRIGGLQDSELYRAVPRQARVTGELRQTNVLTDHQHYRRAAALWRSVVLERASNATKHDDYAAWQARMRAFDVFCLLLVATAMDRVGFRPLTETGFSFARSTEIHLEGPLGGLGLRWEPSRGITLECPRGPAVRFVPLAASLSGLDEAASEANERRARARLAELTESGRDVSANPTVLLYPGTRRQRGAFPSDLSRQLNPDDVGLAASARGVAAQVLPVSPLDILSLERVERVVRRVILTDLFEQFPPSAECRRNVRDRVSLMVPWLQASDSRDHLLVLAPPDESRLSGFARAVKAEQQGLRPRHDDAVRTSLDAVQPEVERTRSYFDQIRLCPVCGARGAFLGRGPSHFVVECGSCGSNWGLDACGKCGCRVPYLDAGSRRPDQDDTFVLDLLDRSFGRDVLAVPCVRAGEESAYVCPKCHTCAGSDEPCGPNCARACATAAS